MGVGFAKIFSDGLCNVLQKEEWGGPSLGPPRKTKTSNQI